MAPIAKGPASLPARIRGSAGSAGQHRGLPAGKQSRRRSIAAALLAQKTATLFRHFPLALAGDQEALHQVRVWSRRLRVALRLLAGKPEGCRSRRAQRLLAQLTRTAGRVRDLDVLLETFHRRLQGLPRRTAEQERLRRRLAALRRRARARVTQDLLDVDVAQLRVHLTKLALRAAPDRLVIGQRFRALCARESRKLEDGFAALGAHLDVVALHGLRRRARRLRYGVEVFLQVFGGPKDATQPWKSLQEGIGVLHDHHVLAEWLARQAAADAKRGQPSLAAAATAEVEWAQATMRRLHDELLAADPIALVRRGLAALGHAPLASIP